MEKLERGDEGAGVRQGEEANEDDGELDAVTLELEVDDDDSILESLDPLQSF